MNTKWWGWGKPQIRFNISERPGVAEYLKEKLNHSKAFSEKRFQIMDVEIPSSRLARKQLEQLQALLEPERVTDSHKEKVLHATGKSYKDLLHLRSMKLKFAPDAVVFAESESDISKVMQFCQDHNCALIPFGGGTSVVGGVDALSPENPNQPVISLDLTRMKRLIAFDKESMIAEFEAGILGPDLEDSLQRQGFTLGHFPQSFEFSTLGGWIAARSSGQNSLLYGGIERLLASVEIIAPSGEIKTWTAPRHAVGPEIKELILGSEGTLGVITKAQLRVRPLPEEKHYFLLGFQNFATATLAVRRIVQSGLSPAMLRISDEVETEAMYRFGHKTATTLGELKSDLSNFYLRTRGFAPPQLSALMVGIEDSSNRVVTIKNEILKIIGDLKFLNLGTSPGQRWLKDRFFLPYLRDDLMDIDIFLDTLETSTTWSNIENLYQQVRSAIVKEFAKDELKVTVLCHISHSYRDGASLYFTILGQQVSDSTQLIAQWARIKTSANQAIIKNGGVISHHHGVGIDHKAYTNWSEATKSSLIALKKSLDPNLIMNPGKLL